MTTQSITPVRLLRDSLISVIPIYRSLLFFFLPRLILSLLKLVIPEILFMLLDSLYGLFIGSVVSGMLAFFSYKKLNQEEVTISQSLQKALNNFYELLFLNTFFLLGIIYFIFPRLWFVRYAVMIEDYSIADAFKRSWQLTRGYGWKIFWAILTLLPIYGVLTFLSSQISAFIFGVSVWDLYREFSTNNPAFVINSLVSIVFYCFFFSPIVSIYNTLMFMRLLALEKRTLDSISV